MAAAVVERTNNPVAVARHDQRTQAELGGDVIIDIGNLAFVGEIDPGAAKDVAHLGVEDRRVGIEPLMNAIFLNQVVEIETNLFPKQLLARVQKIELALGRLPTRPKGPRTIDIDILFYGDAIINEPGLQIPHPELHKRRFTLAPLAEIAPDLVHPVLKNNILHIKNQLKDDLIVKKL